MWCIPPQENAAFVCGMENVLQVYTRPYDESYPVICMDESSKQCAQEIRPPQGMRPGHAARYDAEYERNGSPHPSCARWPMALSRRSAPHLVVVQSLTFG